MDQTTLELQRLRAGKAAKLLQLHEKYAGQGPNPDNKQALRVLIVHAQSKYGSGARNTEPTPYQYNELLFQQQDDDYDEDGFPNRFNEHQIDSLLEMEYIRSSKPLNKKKKKKKKTATAPADASPPSLPTPSPPTPPPPSPPPAQPEEEDTTMQEDAPKDQPEEDDTMQEDVPEAQPEEDTTMHEDAPEAQPEENDPTPPPLPPHVTVDMNTLIPDDLKAIAATISVMLSPILRHLNDINTTLHKQNRALTTRLSRMEDRETATLAVVSQLEQKIDYLVKSSSSQPGAPIPPTTVISPAIPILPGRDKTTWAEIALRLAKKTTHSSTTTPTPPTSAATKQQRTLVATRASDNPPTATMLAIRNAINTALAKANAPPTTRVLLVSPNPKNNLVLLSREDSNAAALLVYKDSIQSAIRSVDEAATTVKPKETWVKIMVHGVALERYNDTDKGMQALQTEIQSLSSTVNLSCTPRYATKPESRLKKTHSSVVIAVNTETEAAHILKHHITIDGTLHRTERFWTARPQDQCQHCQGFGHHWRRCASPPICRLCAGTHNTTEHKCKTCPAKGKLCAHVVALCALCGGPHRASEPTCEKRG